jgi:hypothetical protein
MIERRKYPELAGQVIEADDPHREEFDGEKLARQFVVDLPSGQFWTVMIGKRGKVLALFGVIQATVQEKDGAWVAQCGLPGGAARLVFDVAGETLTVRGAEVTEEVAEKDGKASGEKPST